MIRTLTFNGHVLTGLLVPLAVATDLGGQAIAHMPKCLAMLTSQVMLHQLTLEKAD